MKNKTLNILVKFKEYKIFIWYNCRKTIFDRAPVDPDYVPLPEDRPGGFNWGDRPNN